MRGKRKGQSATEWIAILAVVLIIALLAVLLINSSSVTARAFDHDRSAAYWGSQAKPLELTDWGMNVSALSAKDANLSMQIYNPTTDRITIKSISLSPGYFSEVYNLNDRSFIGDADALSLTMAPGNRLGIFIKQMSTDAGSIEVPNQYEFNLTIEYDRGMGVAQEIGLVPLSGKKN